MPDDAAALARALTCKQALDRQLNCAELLVSPYDLAGFSFVISREQGKGADEV